MPLNTNEKLTESLKQGVRRLEIAGVNLSETAKSVSFTKLYKAIPKVSSNILNFLNSPEKTQSGFSESGYSHQEATAIINYLRQALNLKFIRKQEETKLLSTDYAELNNYIAQLLCANYLRHALTEELFPEQENLQMSGLSFSYVEENKIQVTKASTEEMELDSEELANALEKITGLDPAILKGSLEKELLDYGSMNFDQVTEVFQEICESLIMD